MTEEPPNLSFIRTGDRYPFKWWQRDDNAARDSGYGRQYNWWDCAYEDGGPDGPSTWDQILTKDPLRVILAPLDERT